MRTIWIGLIVLTAACTVSKAQEPAAEPKHSRWENFERLDFVVDGRACLLVLPAAPAPGKPWIWRTEFFGHEPQGDLALLGKGFHVAYMDVQNLYGAPAALDHMDKFYEHLTDQYQLGPRPVLEGFSRGGLFAFNWAARHPDRVSGLYVDAPVCDFKSWPAGWGHGQGSPSDWARCKEVYGLTDEQARAYRFNPVDNLAPLAAQHIPILSVCGDADEVVPIEENTRLVQERYTKLGGPIQVIVKPGVHHHPHSLKDPTPIVEFVLAATGQKPGHAAAGPIRACPANPHYYCYEGKPVLLITSAEHYGAVINKGFDYRVYLDTLQAHGLNYTRFYPGAMFEPAGKFMPGNTLGPKPADLIVPWARSEVPGYRLGGNKFDLDQWDPAYFARFHEFLAEAARRQIFVEICFFNSQYEDTWPLSPLQAENNVQGIGRGDWRAAQTLKDPDLVAREDAYVRKLTQEANAFDNVILEICDEPGHIGTGFELSGPWVAHLGDVVIDTERALPKKHLLAQEVDGPLGGPVDFAADPRFTVIVGQYIWGEDQGEMGGMKGLDYKYRDNKPIELNETAYYPLWYKGDKIADSRVEAWEFMVGGGAAFNQLNGLFTPESPSGKSSENEQLLHGLQILKQFMESFEFVRMAPDKEFLQGGVKPPAFHRALSEPGKQYALYIHHSSDKVGGAYTVIPGEYGEELSLKLLAGRYRAEWINPESGAALGSQTIVHEGGNRALRTPAYKVDIALRMKRVTDE